MKTRTQALTRTEVLRSERRAWWGREETLFYFDGARFWRSLEGRPAHILTSGEAPVRGWRHRSGCRCAACAR
jgi:hypothetical protein